MGDVNGAIYDDQVYGDQPKANIDRSRQRQRDPNDPQTPGTLITKYRAGDRTSLPLPIASLTNLRNRSLSCSSY